MKDFIFSLKILHFIILLLIFFISMAGEVVVDALPYYDHGYDGQGVREAALALVEEETKRYRPTKNYLEHLPLLKFDSFETEIIKNEIERLQARLPIDMLSMKRYELPQPSVGKLNDVGAWQESVDNSGAQLEHQALRILNLQHIEIYGSDEWKNSINILNKIFLKSQKALLELKKEIQDINWKRKTEQNSAGDKLRHLEESWVSLVSKNYEIERVCMELEQDVIDIEKKINLNKSKRTLKRKLSKDI